MKIIKKEMEERQIDLKILNEVLVMYEALANEGKSDLGTQALIKLYD